LLAHAAGPAATEAVAVRFGPRSEGLSLVLLAWKDLVFYRPRLAAMDRRVCRVADEIGAATPRQSALPDELAMIDLARGRVLRALTLARREAVDLSDAIAETIATLETHRSLDRFSQFLILAPTCMAALGERVRRLDEVCGGWQGQSAAGLTLRPFAIPRPGARTPGGPDIRTGPRRGLRG
jgi:hypothetical protein